MEAQKLEQEKSYQTIQLIIPPLKGYSAVHSWVFCPVYIKTWEHGNNEGAIPELQKCQSFSVCFDPAIGRSKAVIAAIIENKSICICTVPQLQL